MAIPNGFKDEVQEVLERIKVLSINAERVRRISNFHLLKEDIVAIHKIIDECEDIIDRQNATIYIGEMIMQGFKNVVPLYGPYHSRGNRWGIQWTLSNTVFESWTISGLPVSFSDLIMEPELMRKFAALEETEKQKEKQKDNPVQ